jgi:hypothetical protein
LQKEYGIEPGSALIKKDTLYWLETDLVDGVSPLGVIQEKIKITL